jgi:hypothetical protein
MPQVVFFTAALDQPSSPADFSTVADEYKLWKGLVK